MSIIGGGGFFADLRNWRDNMQEELMVVTTAQTHRLVSKKNVSKMSDFLRILPDYSQNYPPGKFWEKFDNSHHYSHIMM